jgi:hypothetical protein
LKELEDSDVIEKVQGPTLWVSPLVVVPKANSDIRICVDMRCANKAVQRERFPMPNIEEIIQQMNGSSVFSRLDLSQSFHQIELDEQLRFITTFVYYVAQNAVPKAMTIAEMQEASEKDNTICKIRECIEKNKWTKEDELKPYFIVRNDLTVHESIILKGRKLVIPRKLRQRILQLAHESHQGVLKTKQLLREKVWLPRMDTDLEEMIKTCRACQIMANPNQAPPVNTTKLPDRPWTKLGIDLAGPFTNNEDLLVVIDYYSRFPEVEMFVQLLVLQL